MTKYETMTVPPTVEASAPALVVENSALRGGRETKAMSAVSPPDGADASDLERVFDHAFTYYLRADYERFSELVSTTGADAIDARLHGERLDGSRRRYHTARFDELPDGVFVLHDGRARLVLGESLLGRLRPRAAIIGAKLDRVVIVTVGIILAAEAVHQHRPGFADVGNESGDDRPSVLVVEEYLLRKEFGTAARIRCRSRLNLSRNGVRGEARGDDKSKPRASAPASWILQA